MVFIKGSEKLQANDMDTAGRAVKGCFHFGPELFDDSSGAGLGQVSRVAVNVDDEELSDT